MVQSGLSWVADGASVAPGGDLMGSTSELIGRIEESTFAAVFGKKGKWFDVSGSVLRDNPEILGNLFDLLSRSYGKIGGHHKFGSPKSFLRGDLVVHAVDVDRDPDADAFQVHRKTPHGLKAVAMGTDGGSVAKSSWVGRAKKLFSSRGFYIEVSGAPAHVLLKQGVPAVGDASTVEAVLGSGRPIEWVGAHPDGKFRGVVGWYRRSVGGKDMLKIMLGNPL